MNRLEQLTRAFPEIPPSVVLKADVFREGIQHTPDLNKIARWACPQTHNVYGSRGGKERKIVNFVFRSSGFVFLAVLFAQAELGFATDAEMERKRAAEVGLQPGMVLDQATAHLAADLLPPEILKHYQKGEYRNVYSAWPAVTPGLGKVFEEQTQRNAETLTVDELGTIVDRSTGQQPPYIYGTPFPDIDPADPKAPVKIIWNYFYTDQWWNGNIHSTVDLMWLNPTGIDRIAGQQVYYKFYEGLPPDQRDPENPNNLLAQLIAITSKPADLYGTTALSWRFRDAHKRDSLWAYVPALRRVRPVSPANRSDGFLGSDMSQDDGQFFDGKPEDFNWKLVGEREMLRFADPGSLTGSLEMKELPGGGWRAMLEPIPAYGFEDKSWTGVAWAPIAHHLVRRKAWVLEAVPKDPYYLYGKLELWVDQKSWEGGFNRKFDWKGELLATLQTQGGPIFCMSEGRCLTSGPADEIAQFSENIKMNRATAITAPENDRHVPLQASFFDYQTLYRLGK